ncbi:GPW/gp25 family protein [Paludibacterium paludis]|nr:GPW/gp25 family protein [Paludibacterium paludis]
MSAKTGTALGEIDHIRQSLHKLFTTPIGSRVMRREFGSAIPDLIDQPHHGATRLRLMSAAVMAIAAWEPRVSVKSLMVDTLGDGSAAVFDLELVLREGPGAGTTTRIQVPMKG